MYHFQLPWSNSEDLSISYDTFADATRASLLQSCPFLPAPPSAGNVATGSWMLGSTELVLTLTRDIPAGSKLRIVLPTAAGVALPTRGLSTNDQFLAVDASNKKGKMHEIIVETSAALASS